MQGVSADTYGVVPNLFGPGLGGFQDANPATGTKGTQARATLFNDMLGNLLNVLALGGVAPTPGRYQDLADAILALVVEHGQCQLQFVSTTALRLMPHGGNGLRVAGVRYHLPAGGIAIASTNVMVSGVTGANLAAGTAYLVYVTDNGAGALIPDFWPAAGGHLTDSTVGNIGVEVRDNAGVLDPSRTLIGMVLTDGAAHFSDFTTLSWFNRRQKLNRTSFSSSPSTSSTTPVELSSSIRNTFITWGDEIVDYRIAGSVSTGGSAQEALTAVGFDGATPELEAAVFTAIHTSSDGSATVGMANVAGAKSGLTEGQHYATLVGTVTSGATWQGGTTPIAGGSANPPCVLDILVKG